MNKCPCCGQDSPVKVLINGLDVSFRGQTVKLRHTPLAFLRALLKGGSYSAERLKLAVYGPGCVASAHLVEAHICRLRKQIKPLGLKIVTDYGTGYRLEYPMEPTNADRPA